MDFRPSPELYPFESRWFDSSAGRVNYVDEGAGRPIVMCHGNPTWSFLFRHLIQELRGEFRCVAMDYLGFGLSERPTGFGYTAREHADVLAGLVRELDLRDAIVLGHDWGGPIGLGAAVAEPDRFSGVALGNTWFWPAGLRAQVFSTVMSSPPLQWAIKHRNFFVEQILPGQVVRDLTPQEMEHYRAVQPTAPARAGVAEFPRQIVAAKPFLAELEREVPRRLGDRPALITYPMKDPAFPASASLPRLRAAFPDHEVVELPDAKHYFFEDASADVAAALRARFG